MKFSLALLAVAGIATYAEAIIVLGTTAAAGTTTVTAATAANAAALAGIGGLVLGAGILGIAVLASRRGKRSVEDGVKEEAVFSLVSASDAFGCALKLVCLLEAKAEADLTDDDSFILNIFGRDPEAPSIDKMKSTRGAYDYAAFMGSKFGPDACEQLFHTCEASYKDMIAYVAQLRA
ncbi:uncharacterized protein LOC119103623 [Pollicipes pollicipes]|uniref:uncharacterized protein LOC119103623 n=1 Tax=Pollicipes pollicipes TaxID=41117 RepID=UPI00188507DD|nr:uncharacterized protein LOC119103623 [Pollicipes pollicipes]